MKIFLILVSLTFIVSKASCKPNINIDINLNINIQLDSKVHDNPNNCKKKTTTSRTTLTTTTHSSSTNFSIFLSREFSFQTISCFYYSLL
jgi:hypothetical protein